MQNIVYIFEKTADFEDQLPKMIKPVLNRSSDINTENEALRLFFRAVNQRLLTDIQNMMGTDYDETYAYNLIDQVKQHDPTGISYNHWLIVQVLKYNLNLDDQGNTVSKYLDYFDTIKNIPGLLPSTDIQQYTWEELIETTRNIDYTSNKQQWLDLVDQGTKEVAYVVETNTNEIKILELNNKEALMEFSRGTKLDTNNPRIAEEWIARGPYYGFVAINDKFLWDPYESKLLDSSNNTIKLDKEIDMNNPDALRNLDMKDVYIDDIKILLTQVLGVNFGYKTDNFEEGKDYNVKYKEGAYEVRQYLTPESLFADSQGTEWCTGKQLDYAKQYIDTNMHIVFKHDTPRLAYSETNDTLWNIKDIVIEDDNKELKEEIEVLYTALNIIENKKLINAAKNNDIQGVKQALDHGANVHAEDDAALRWSAVYGYTDIVELLLKYGANVHAEDDYALGLAAENGHTDTVEVLLKYGADVHGGNDAALCWAAVYGYTDIVELLLKYGANVHAENDYALRGSAYNGHTDIVELLLKYGAKVHANNDEALRWSADNGHTDTVELLKKHYKKNNLPLPQGFK